jgi:hypothetical protein
LKNILPSPKYFNTGSSSFGSKKPGIEMGAESSLVIITVVGNPV